MYVMEYMVLDNQCAIICDILILWF
uniref:Uncharacterized protein n=1 Tax=Arundo donax TaxID=35708 RepID=A0A0A9C2A1_ARUDO